MFWNAGKFTASEGRVTQHGGEAVMILTGRCVRPARRNGLSSRESVVAVTGIEPVT
jgi:hypothetical protein